MADQPSAASTTRQFDPAALLVAMGLAALAGATDVYGLTRLRDVFVSFMSGNTTLLGLAIGHGDWPRAGLIAGVVALFVGGAAGGAILAELSGRHHAPAVLAAITALLCVPLLHDPATVPALVLAMGALNMTVGRIGTTSVGLTYVTGALVKLGQGVGRMLAGVKEPRDWLLQGAMWASLLAGAIAAALLQAQLGPHRYWPLPLAAGLLTLAVLVLERRAVKRPPPRSSPNWR